MGIRQRLKRLVYGSAPIVRGRFPYFGQTVYFPLGSHIFERACAEGIYESDIVSAITALATDGTTYLDVGANIGLLSIPILVRKPTVQVVSIEASPDTLRYLSRTHSESAYRDRWTLIPTAVGAASGEIDFWAAPPEQGAFDGTRDTGRGGVKQRISVPCQTLDEIWTSLGAPPVSVVKMDIEGGETNAILGARRLIENERPALIIEWQRENLSAYGLRPDHLHQICRDLDYRPWAVTTLCPVPEGRLLDLLLARTEAVLLVPANETSEPHALPTP